jgi:hypothetical protein
MAGLEIMLHRQFADQLLNLSKELRRWGAQAEERLLKAHRRIEQRFIAEAKRRVPVDTGTLRQRIIGNTYSENGQIVTEVGTNIPGYPVYLEFGTEHIAGGAVKALGDDPGITDAQAIKDWPAKRAELKDKSGTANPRVAAAIAKSSAQEQMPWLRPAFSSIREWAIQQQAAALTPPSAQQGAG